MTQGHSATTRQINTDAEIRTVAEDRLGRTPFCRRVAERIRSAGSGPSVVFGLAGPWGAGKTSVLNMVEELLKQESGELARLPGVRLGQLVGVTDQHDLAIDVAASEIDVEGFAGRETYRRVVSEA